MSEPLERNSRALEKGVQCTLSENFCGTNVQNEKNEISGHILAHAGGHDYC